MEDEGREVQMDRFQKWEQPEWRTDFITTGQDPELAELLHKRVFGDSAPPGPRHGAPANQLFKMAKEIVFDVNEEGQATLTPMTWIIDTDSIEYRLSGIIKATFTTDESAKVMLLDALVNEVPVVPNNEVVAPRLEALFADMMTNGVTHFVDGEEQTYAVTGHLLLTHEGAPDSGRVIAQPAEFSALQRRLEHEVEQGRQAKIALARITAALRELRELLTREERNEHDLQRCLTKYPIFFGPSYRRILPKHKLGSEYEADYALEIVDGSIDVMEIEASTHRLYGKRGNPSQALIHAEQQVLDWLAWLDEQSSYARRNLPGVRRACGIVVIGRRANLSEKDVERLRWRNMMYGGRLTILTFDDLIDRCEAIRSLLIEQQVQESNS
ncbi:Shedu anti-phage system protein SduA domain-containing protein [Micromonospora sp. NPDC049274]|uniref:Shedu anti-phage system protein SduA domain-containing protein n=1 Tax=Micromonospora sp. NPDC049274 TaxID=3154829 RepID=UPI0034191EC7